MKPQPQLYVGIDPGLGGAVAVIDQRGNVISVHDTPTLTVKRAKGHKRVYLEPEMVNILEAVKTTGDVRIVGIERQQAMPAQGGTSMFSIGYGYGLWIMACTALRLPYQIVEASTWKREVGIPKGSSKGESIRAGLRLFPTAPLARKKDDGRADAILIAEAVRRKFDPVRPSA